jgi:hypothetical protein
MRTLATFILAVAACLSFTSAQTATTNQITQTQAIALASHLKVGMREEDAVSFLRRGGLKDWGSIGDSFGWAHCFSLTNRCSLVLDVKPKYLRSDGAWADGLVRAASIQSNGVNIVSINLTNAP